MNVAQWLDWLPGLLAGALVSLQVAGAALLIGLPVGCLLAFAVSARSRLVRWGSVLIVELGRGTPVLMVLYFLYYGLPTVGVVTDAFAAAALGLAYTTAAYTSEIFRAGVQAVPAGEREAAAALGMSRFDVVRDVILPQGLRLALPAIFAFAISLFQATSLTFAITLPELLSRAYSIGSSTFQYLSVLTLAGLLYLVITVPASLLVERIERREEPNAPRAFTRLWRRTPSSPAA